MKDDLCNECRLFSPPVWKHHGVSDMLICCLPAVLSTERHHVDPQGPAVVWHLHQFDYVSGRRWRMEGGGRECRGEGWHHVGRNKNRKWDDGDGRKKNDNNGRVSINPNGKQERIGGDRQKRDGKTEQSKSIKRVWGTTSGTRTSDTSRINTCLQCVRHAKPNSDDCEGRWSRL